jgi:hypothetical protein
LKAPVSQVETGVFILIGSFNRIISPASTIAAAWAAKKA